MTKRKHEKAFKQLMKATKKYQKALYKYQKRVGKKRTGPVGIPECCEHLDDVMFDLNQARIDS